MLVAGLDLTPAAAQISGSAMLASDYRLRGNSHSRRQPVLAVSLGYDDKSGLFADGTAIALRTRQGKLRVMGGVAALGYAWKLDGGPSVDLGVMRTEYGVHGRYGRPTGYTELFAGMTGRTLAVRVAFSPDYVWPNTNILYASADLTKRPDDDWRITGHAGLFAQLSGGPPRPMRSLQYDWSLGVARQLGRFDIQADLSGGGPDHDYFEGTPHSKTAATVRISVAF